VGELSVAVTDAADWLAAEEADLVAQIAAGDAGSPVTEPYRRYGRRLYRFGVQNLGNEAPAEEMVQETFVRLWRTARKFDAGKVSVGLTFMSLPAASLPTGPAQAEVIRLAQEGLTRSQIAEFLSLPLGTVKARTYHGIRALGTALIERGFHAV
jgi:DNA-directed RNA polymerase specialized sigma24 family protein